MSESMKMTWFVLGFILASASTGSCGKSDTVEPVKQTPSIAKTTKKPSSKQIEENNDAKSCQPPWFLGEWEARDLRAKSIADLKNARTLEGKLQSATKYFTAFEFLVPLDKSCTATKELEQRMSDGVQEFFLTVAEFVDYDFDPQWRDDNGRFKPKLSIIKDLEPNFFDLLAPHPKVPHFINNKQGNLNALAMAMDNPSRSGPITLYSIVTHALTREFEINGLISEGRLTLDEVPPYQREVFANRDLSIYLLRLRMNLLALHALNALTDLNSALAPFSARNIVVDLNDPRLNFSLLEFTIHHMLRDGALAVNDVLRKINANHTYNKTLRQLLGRLEILKSDSSENGAILKYYENELRQVQRELLSN